MFLPHFRLYSFINHHSFIFKESPEQPPEPGAVDKAKKPVDKYEKWRAELENKKKEIKKDFDAKRDSFNIIGLSAEQEKNLEAFPEELRDKIRKELIFVKSCIRAVEWLHSNAGKISDEKREEIRQLMTLQVFAKYEDHRFNLENGIKKKNVDRIGQILSKLYALDRHPADVVWEEIWNAIDIAMYPPDLKQEAFEAAISSAKSAIRSDAFNDSLVTSHIKQSQYIDPMVQTYSAEHQREVKDYYLKLEAESTVIKEVRRIFLQEWPQAQYSTLNASIQSILSSIGNIQIQIADGKFKDWEKLREANRQYERRKVEKIAIERVVALIENLYGLPASSKRPRGDSPDEKKERDAAEENLEKDLKSIP